MNNFVRNINDKNRIALMLLYGENGSFVPVDMFYLISTAHAYLSDDMYELKGFKTIYYNDDAYFYSNDNKSIILKAEDCVKLFERYVGVNDDFSFNKVDFNACMVYEKYLFKKYTPYSLDDLNAYFDNGYTEMDGRNYSFIPIVFKDNEKVIDNKLEENYADFNLVRKLRKRASVNKN